MLKLYYYPNNASLAPHFLLHHVKVDYELVLVERESEGHKSADYLKLNPAGRIPTLVIDDQPIFESPAICIHICESYSEYELIPEIGGPKRPLFFQWLTFLNNTLQAELMVRYYPHRHTNDESNIPNIISAQDERIADALSIINDQLDGNEFLLGEKLSACDYFLFMLAEWSLLLEKSPMDYTNLAMYLNRLSENPSVKAVCEFEDIDLRPFKI
ncbi:glutathione S-transferase family protein [Psychrobacter sp. SZ93C1]|uniref:glutathione S-transferase family protein n=1 Tax=Psychrobacter sp. SZ93C1 TaxID=2792058 RepID=UPI0018CED230|nr:glutathione S-transferase [Psychrobacter sp. SZ93C1]MBH0066375.1 glutathione S-transferase [Psychrobacter sp. SZ93C1]